MKNLFLLLMLTLVTACYQIKNFHEIDEGKYFRSAQLSGEELEHAIQDNGIKTVINLRGEKDVDWYHEEEAATRKMGVTLINIGMSAKRLPHKQDLLKLLEAFENAERPMLIHCQGGADRTGEATAIYQMLYMGKSKKEALKMLTPKYFHLKKRMPAKRYFIKELWQGIEWAHNQYDPCRGEFKYYDTNVKECETL